MALSVSARVVWLACLLALPTAASAQDLADDAFATQLVGRWEGQGTYGDSTLSLSREWTLELGGRFLVAEMGVSMPNGGSFGARMYWRLAGDGEYDVTWMDAQGRMQQLVVTRQDAAASVSTVYLARLVPGEPEWRKWEFEVTGENVPRISPDGRRVAVERGAGEDRDVWVHDPARGTVSPLTREPGVDWFPSWTPDGREIVFTSTRHGGSTNLYRRSADGTGPVTRLGTSDSAQFPYTWSPDGQSLVFVELTLGQGLLNIRLLTMEADAESRAIVEGAYSASNPAVSPDGRWLAYRSDESGRDEIYVERFPELGGRIQVSTDGGQAPLWSSNGREIFYRDDEAMMRVAVDAGPPLSVGLPEQLFEGPYLNDAARNYDVTSDGTRFLMVKGASATAARTIRVVLNWAAELDTSRSPN